MQNLRVSAPGRVVLAGEHCDYLSLPVISAAINLRVIVTGSLKRTQPFLTCFLEDFNKTEEFELSQEAPYVGDRDRDYLRAGWNLLFRKGWAPVGNINTRIRGKIPISAGLSSSSALNVAWLKFLLELNEIRIDPVELAKLAYNAEVVEFSEPGGMQDQILSSFGGIRYIEFNPPESFPSSIPLVVNLESLIVCDSTQPKKTLNTLSRVRRLVEDALNTIRRKDARFSLQNSSIEDLSVLSSKIPQSCLCILKGVLRNRNITRQMKSELIGNIDLNVIGNLLNQQHELLRDVFHLSTPKIEQIIQKAKSTGALGCKINGSGEGGSILCISSPDCEKSVIRALKSEGGVPYSVTVAQGARIEF